MRKLIIIPAYNESECIKNTVDNIVNKAPDFDYVVINDCSKDNTKEILENNRMNYVSGPINLGIGGAVQTGYKYALNNGYDIAIQMDGDGQHDVEYVRRLTDLIESGEADIVIGSRFIEKQGFQSSGMRRFGIKFLSGLIRIVCGTKVHDVTSGFRAVNRKYIELYAKEYPTDYPEPEAIVKASLSGAVIKEAPVIMKERETGTSSITPFKSMYYMVKVSLAIILCRISNKRSK